MKKDRLMVCILVIIMVVGVCVVTGAYIVHRMTGSRIKDTTEDTEVDDSTQIESTAESIIREETIMKETTKSVQTQTATEATSESYDPDAEFYITKIDDELFARIDGKSYKPDCTVPLSELRYVHVLHVDNKGETHTGELICNKTIADDLMEIFRELYEAKYPIEKIRLVDEYDADDDASMADNNSSCFNYRTVPGKSTLSKHAKGLAIDINTLYNPYIHTVDGRKVIQPYNATEYEDRSAEYPYKIDPDDICVKLFKEHGFTWGGDWSSEKDYQHFQK